MNYVNHIRRYEKMRGIKRASSYTFEDLFSKSAAEVGTSSTLALKNRRTQEFLQDQENIKSQARRVIEAFVATIKQLRLESDKDESELFKLLEQTPSVLTFLDTYVGTNDKKREAMLNRFVNVIQGKVPLEKVTQSLNTSLQKSYVDQQLKQDKKVLTTSIKEFLSLFPDNMVVDLDPDGKIKEVRDRFANKSESLDVKHARMVDIVSTFDDINNRVFSDLRKPFGSFDQCSALAVIIMFETGMRPGDRKNGIWFDMTEEKPLLSNKDKENATNKVWLKTYGISNIETQHVKFSGSSAIINFRGKMGTINNGVLKNPLAVETLKQYYDSAIANGHERLLVNSAGRPLTLDRLSDYCARYNFRPTDLRKLKATETFYENLKIEQAQLYSELRTFANSDQTRTLVAEAVYQAAMRALTKSQIALSHEQVRVTINKYVDPVVLLNFLSHGRIDTSFSNLIMDGKTLFRFDPALFIKAAMEDGGLI